MKGTTDGAEAAAEVADGLEGLAQRFLDTEQTDAEAADGDGASAGGEPAAEPDGEGASAGGEPAAEPVGDGAAEDVEAGGEAEWTEAQQAAFDKRMARETRKRRELEDETQALRDEVAELRRSLDGRGAEDGRREPGRGVAASATTEREIEQREERVQALMAFAVEHWEDGYAGSGSADDPTIPAERLHRQYFALQRELTVELPRARRRVQQAAQERAAAVREFPELADPRSALSKQVRATLDLFPGLAHQPGAERLAADAVLGRLARARSAARPPAPRRAPTAPTAGGPGRAVPAAAERRQVDVKRVRAAEPGEGAAVLAQELLRAGL